MRGHAASLGARQEQAMARSTATNLVDKEKVCQGQEVERVSRSATDTWSLGLAVLHVDVQLMMVSGTRSRSRWS